MQLVLDLAAYLAVAAVGLPALLLFVEVLASLLPGRASSSEPSQGPREPVTVLIPAHDEAPTIGTMLERLRAALGPADRVLVVADNCGDETAAVCRRAGAEVVERNDPERRGKGYALQFGIDHLKSTRPPVVVVVDADCEAAPSAFDRCVEQVRRSGRPVQSRYLMSPPRGTGSEHAISSLAILLRNHVRPLGAQRLGAPAPLVGSGMAFSWKALNAVHVGSGNIVEDLQWGVDLAVAGHPPRYEPSARFEAPLPADQVAANCQRTRWAHGHMATLFSQCPRLLAEGIRQRRPGLLILAADLAIPPLSLLAAAQALTALALCLAGEWGQLASGPLLLLGAAAALLVGSVLIGWLRHGRRVLPARMLLGIPAYGLRKLPLYARALVRRERRWIRTPRDPAPGGATGGVPRSTAPAQRRAAATQATRED
jgi:cellulose synthase/poly-beta-1,6-N-acetylglucosamine synthase-like glycosyltransferase